MTAHGTTPARFARYRDLWARLCAAGARLTDLHEAGRRGTPEWQAAERDYERVLAAIRLAQAAMHTDN